MMAQADIEILSNFLAQALPQSPPEMPPGDIVLQAGRYFLDAPYAAGTLETSGPESLVVNLRAFDCFTLVESCCALALLVRRIIVNNQTEGHWQPVANNETGANDDERGAERSVPTIRQGRATAAAAISSSDRSAGGEATLLSDRCSAANAPAFAAILQRLRYRNGIIAGYASRRHYFSDWLADNAGHGLLRDMTARLGGRPIQKVIAFMTQHRELYPSLRDEDAYEQLRAAEARLSALPRSLLPKEAIACWEGKIAPGDVVAIATHEDGLDVTHAGFAIRRAGRLHLLHASSEAGRVVVSPETLAAYLQARENRAGIIVARIN